MKGQIATEYVILVGAVFILIITIFYFATTESVKTIQLNKAENVVNTIAKTADYMHALGPGSQDLIEINMPGNVNTINISNREIVLNLGIFGATTDIIAETRANISGTISTKSGIRHITLKVLDNGAVEIED